jgi:hypothetical protein
VVHHRRRPAAASGACGAINRAFPPPWRRLSAPATAIANKIAALKQGTRPRAAD